MLSGDAEDDQEEYLVDSYGEDLQSTVLKAGHHGSSSSSSEPFIEAVQPQAVVISSDYNSQYGHPTEAVLERFADRSIPAYWTATHGDIVLVSDGSGVSVQTQREAPTDPLSIRDGEPVADGSDSDETDDTDTEENETSSIDPGATLEVATVNADTGGGDRENLTDEYVVFENTGDDTLDLSGWTVEDEAGRSYEFPDGFTLEAGATVTLRTGSGTDTDTGVYWESGSPIWNNDGDTVIVRTDSGDIVMEESY